MIPSQRYAAQPELRSVAQSFSSLVDSMRYLQKSKELDEKIDELKEETEERLESLDALKTDILKLIEKQTENLGESRAAELSKQIIGFSTTAIDQMKQKINQETQKEHNALVSDSNSEKTKTMKSLEAFLATSPLPLIEHSIVLTLQDMAYGAKARYTCQDSIQYEFALDTKVSPFFRTQFRLGEFDHSLKIPVGVGKSWLKKNPVPDFQRLDQYVIFTAEATESSLILECSDTEKEAHLKIVYTKQGNHTSLTLEHSQDGSTLDITSEPSLNVHLDTESFIRSTERIWLGINDLERKKISLSRITCDDKSVLEDWKSADFLTKAWKAIAPRIREAMKAKGDKSVTDSDNLDEKTVREKLKTLGPQAEQIVSILRLDR